VGSHAPPLPRTQLLVTARLAAGLAAALGAIIAHADEIPARAAPSGLVIHEPAETLRDFCRAEGDRLWLLLPGGARFELVTSTDDPEISNPGDGAFHPYQPEVVRAALAATRFPIDGIGAEIFLLPYPRRGGLESAAGPGLVLLAPGVRPLTLEHQHAELIHELGHVVHHALLPDTDLERWARYRALRGIADPTRYHAGAAHACRPHEIFAEDFRALFGDALANYSGSIENESLPLPSRVPGLEAFFLELAGRTPRQRLSAFPNPAGGSVRFHRAGGDPAPLDLFDAAGRRITSLMPESRDSGWSWAWDGRDSAGASLAPGVVWARVRGEREPAVRIVRMR
jgi:hypothetical protein